MKEKSMLILNGVLLIFMGLLSSCERYHFSTPLPVDERNIYEFPKSFRGTWLVHEDTFEIGSNFLRNISWESDKIYSGVLTRYQPASLKTVRYDSAKHSMDTVINYFIRGKKIYRNSEDLAPGSFFKIKDDTIYLNTRNKMEVYLGPYAFLRRISEDAFILNMSEEGIWSEITGKGTWWQLALIEKTADREIFIRLIRDKGLLESTGAYAELCKDSVTLRKSDYYFDSHFTRQELLRLIDKGLFEDRKDPIEIRKKIR